MKEHFKLLIDPPDIPKATITPTVQFQGNSGIVT